MTKWKRQSSDPAASINYPARLAERWLLIAALSAEVLGMVSCAPKKYPIYQAPHMGAEYQFDQGMHPPKHKLGLFSKRMRKSMEQRGMP